MKRYISLSLTIGIVLGVLLWPQHADSHDALTTTVQFDREIVCILDAHCVMCHDANGPAFPLDTYEQTFLVRREIRVDAISRRMAPWAAVGGYGDFANDNSLTLREIQFFVSWAEGWGPRNGGVAYTDIATTGTQPKVIEAHVDFSRWALGEPNRIVQLSTNTIEPQQKEEVKHTVVDLGLKSDSWLRGLEYKPSDHRVVRAAFFKIQESGQWIGSWTPWYGFVNLPKGLSYRLPAGSHIAVDIYYRSTNEKVVEHGSLGMFFSPQPSEKNISDVVLESKTDAQPGAHLQRFHADTKLAADMNVLAVWPEIRPGLKSVEVAARTGDGGTQILLFAKDFPMDWPTPYIFKTPVALTKGTDLFVDAYYASGGDTPPVGIRLTMSAYQRTALPKEKPVEVKAPQEPPQRYKLAGTVQSVDAKSGKLTIQHSAIPGYMPAMTMGYEIAKAEDLTKISAGDQIQADLVVIGTQMHLANIKVVARAK